MSAEITQRQQQHELLRRMDDIGRQLEKALQTLQKVNSEMSDLATCQEDLNQVISPFAVAFLQSPSTTS